MTSLLFAALCACDRMDRQPKYHPLDPSPFFSDGRASRPSLLDTVARGNLQLDAHLYEGKVNGKDAETFPFPITRAVLARGRERYDIACAPCHGRVGDGEGMIVKRGFPHPPSYHSERLREAPLGHYFDVITNGFGRMYAQVERVDVEDRWAIIAYIRALQLSQHATLNDVPRSERAALERSSN